MSLRDDLIRDLRETQRRNHVARWLYAFGALSGFALAWFLRFWLFGAAAMFFVGLGAYNEHLIYTIDEGLKDLEQ